MSELTSIRVPTGTPAPTSYSRRGRLYPEAVRLRRLRVVYALLLFGVHLRPRRMVAVHDHWPFPTLRLHVPLIVICCQFGFWQDPPGQDECPSRPGAKPP